MTVGKTIVLYLNNFLLNIKLFLKKIEETKNIWKIPHLIIQENAIFLKCDRVSSSVIQLESVIQLQLLFWF